MRYRAYHQSESLQRRVECRHDRSHPEYVGGQNWEEDAGPKYPAAGWVGVEQHHREQLAGMVNELHPNFDYPGSSRGEYNGA